MMGRQRDLLLAGATCLCLTTSALAAELDPALAPMLAEAGSLRVVYVLRDPSPSPARTLDRRLGAGARASAQHAAISAVLRRTGQTIIYTSPFTGVIVAEGSGAAIAEAARDPQVAAVYREGVHRLRLDVSRRTTQAAPVQARGMRGAGVRVGIVETGRIGAHPALPPAQRLTRQPGVGPISTHKTEVAGIVQSNDAVHGGVTPRVVLIDGNAANGSDAALMAAADCVVERGAVAINMSFGADTDGRWDAFADYVDRLVYNTGVTVVVAVSNSCDQRMGSPEIAFNDLSVGAFSDRNTPALDDDRHACEPSVNPSFSAYRDPPSLHGDREQPDVVAPGHLIHSTVPPFGFADDSGTSFAAPHVTGGIALLQSRAAFSLARQAERVRAIVMASARANIEGADLMSERDGAGAVRLAAADAVLQAGNSWWFTTAGGSNGFPRRQGFSASTGQKVRVALAWAHKPDGGHQTVSTDLDLQVLDPDGSIVARASSRDGNAELAGFVAAVAGRYTIHVDAVRPSPGPEHVGLAVSLTDR